MEIWKNGLGVTKSDHTDKWSVVWSKTRLRKTGLSKFKLKIIKTYEEMKVYIGMACKELSENCHNLNVEKNSYLYHVHEDKIYVDGQPMNTFDSSPKKTELVVDVLVDMNSKKMRVIMDGKKSHRVLVKELEEG